MNARRGARTAGRVALVAGRAELRRRARRRARRRRRERRRAPQRPAAVAVLDRVAIGVGRGLVAGVAATAAMTISSTAEMKLRHREPSDAPAEVAGKLLGVKPRKRAGARFATIAHATTGIGLGTTRGLLGAAGVEAPAAPAAFFATAWLPELIVVPAAGAAPPPWRWGALELTISALHHGVYAAAGEAAYRALTSGAPRV